MTGKISDPRQEFMIKENKNNDWETKYEIVTINVPKFLEKVSNKVLRAGKYLNAIIECGNPITQDNLIASQHKKSNEAILQMIDFAYNFASSSLLNLMLHENDLMGRLLSVKRYFLLQQGDFIAQFMDACENELQKSVEKVTPMKIEKLLELTVRLSSAKHDKYQDDLKIVFLPYSIYSQSLKIFTDTDETVYDFNELLELTGVESFSFGYKAKWPISIVLNQTTISKYQILFRLLYFCKHVERQLHKQWSCGMRKIRVGEVNSFKRSANGLSQKMIIAIQNIEYYMMVEVIEPNFHIFLDQLNHVKNIDEVLTHHENFLQLCLRDCLLTNQTILKSILELCNICLRFCSFLITDIESTNDKNVEAQVNEYSSLFTEQILQLLKDLNAAYSINPTEKLINLIHRINFNLFYQEQS